MIAHFIIGWVLLSIATSAVWTGVFVILESTYEDDP